MSLSKMPRQTNFELLRILALFMVVLIHLATSGIKLLPITHTNWFIATLLESLSRPAVHIFILLGGYFLGTREITPLQALKRTATLATPLIILGIIHYLSFVRPIALSTVLPFMQTFITGKLSYSGTEWYGHLWFLYPYAILMLLSPLLNSAIITLEKKHFQQLLLVMGVLFLLFPSINLTVGAKIIYATGNSYPYFITSYLMGGYIRRFGLPFSSLQLILLYGVSSLWTWGMTIVQAHWLHPVKHKLLLGNLGAYDNMFVNEQLGVFIGAVALFGLFSKLKGPQTSLLQSMGKSGFYGYTIHMFILFRLFALIPYKSELLFSNWYFPVTILLVLITTLLALLYGKFTTRIIP